MIIAAFFVVALAILVGLTLPAVRLSTEWRAMTAPLASIIGSGFLVSAPLLARELGGLAIVGIAGLCALAWWIGGAIRFNIAEVEPLMAAARPPPALAVLERLSHLALVFAYVVSVAYYLVLLGAFVTRAVVGTPDPVAAKTIASVLLALIGWLGWSGGLAKVLSVESLVVAFKLAIIGGFLAALAMFCGLRLAAGLPVSPPPPRGDWGTVPVLLGFLIMVQGFETSRFLGESFDAATRIRTMRRAQAVASGIYLLFFAFLSPLLAMAAAGSGETGIIDVAARVAPLLPLALTLGAVASQFSAGVADSIGCAGLAGDTVRRLGTARAFPLVALASGLVLWGTDIFGVIALASRAFAAYYMLQCLVAAVATHRRAGWSPAALWRLALALVCAGIAAFGLPVA